MSNSEPRADWKEGRRRAASEAIVDAAWELVREAGLAGLALRDLAQRAGITTPTVYVYFDSKNAIYDAMFGRAAVEFVEWMTRPFESDDPEAMLIVGVHRFVEFCTCDVARYQLLFQRTIPEFEPSAQMFAPAVRALELAGERLALAGVTEARHVDMWTAWTTGLVDQQISNDPGGDRWTRLIEEYVTMFLAHARSTSPAQRRPHTTAPSKGTRP